MMLTRRNKVARSPDIWPGFVDAISTLLLVLIFLLVVFVLAQFFLSHALSGRDEALNRLNQQVTMHRVLTTFFLLTVTHVLIQA